METEISVILKDGEKKIKAVVSAGCRHYIKIFDDVPDACEWVHIIEEALSQGMRPKECKILAR